MSTSTANRPVSGRINVHEPSDYPIILGESLKNERSPTSQVFRFRYNWEPQQGRAGQRGTLKRSNGSMQLAYTGDSSESQTYSYTASSKSDHHDETEPSTQFALVFDPTKSAYILEQISQSFDFNLTSAHGQTRDEVKQHKQINASRIDEHPNESSREIVSVDQDEEHPDASNPFDFRHFLSEAKENAEKATQAAGGRTPLPGSRTPLSVVSSPSLAANRFHPASTQQFRPTPTSAPIPKRPPIVKSVGTLASKRQGPVKRKPAATKPPASQPLSSEIVSSSSDEDTQDTITISQPSTTQTVDRAHTRNTSTISAGRSPNIVVTSGDLEIDMGSPIHEPIRRAALDLDAFRSQTHTPTLPHSSNNSRRPAPLTHQDIEMRDRSEDEADDMDDDDDEHFEDIDKPANVDDDEDEDIDVDELALGSPMPKKSDDRGDELEKMPSPPTPSAPPTVDDDEDDFLAAELEKELAYEDESEVSEEE